MVIVLNFYHRERGMDWAAFESNFGDAAMTLFYKELRWRRMLLHNMGKSSSLLHLEEIAFFIQSISFWLYFFSSKSVISCWYAETFPIFMKIKYIFIYVNEKLYFLVILVVFIFKVVLTTTDFELYLFI